jgi:translocation protein SEC62
MSSMQQQQLTAPPHLRAVADFLRSSKAGMRIRTGVVAGKRADYFKGLSISSLHAASSR